MTNELEGRICLITGASSGIGKETMVALARMGATVVGVIRDPVKGEVARREIMTRSGSEKVELMKCDFSSQKSIRQLAADFKAKHPALHVLVNNAGGTSKKRELTEDGLERTFAVNHLGYFLLTTLLLELLEKSAPARIVNIASEGHRRGKIDFDDLKMDRKYSEFAAYCTSKLANVLFTLELARRLEGKGVVVNAVHPGVVATGIWSTQTGIVAMALGVMKRVYMITPEQGARPMIYLASSPEAATISGKYYKELKQVYPSRLSQDEALARRLWTVSEELTRAKG